MRGMDRDVGFVIGAHRGESNILNSGRGERKYLYALLYALLVRQSLPYAHGASRVRASERTMAESVRVTPFYESVTSRGLSLPRRSRVAPASLPRRPAAREDTTGMSARSGAARVPPGMGHE
jgi:hypothetical protein